MSRKTWNTVGKSARIEYEVKKSVFIADVAPVSTGEEATDFLRKIKKEFPDARHHVYAYRAGDETLEQRYSDDGEPSGTAGMPMLDVIVKNEIVDVCVVVTRYFGGVLLGTGGLVRAYSQGCKIALEAGKIILMQSCLICAARCNYNQYGKVSSLIMETGGVVDDTVFESDVQLKFHIQPELLPQLNKRLADATAGEIQAKADGEDYFIAESE